MGWKGHRLCLLNSGELHNLASGYHRLTVTIRLPPSPSDRRQLCLMNSGELGGSYVLDGATDCGRATVLWQALLGGV